MVDTELDQFEITKLGTQLSMDIGEVAYTIDQECMRA